MVSIYDLLNIYSVVGCVFALLWFYNRSAYNYWRKLDVKYLEPIPFLGNTAPVLFQLTSIKDSYESIYRALGDEPFGGIYEIFQPRLIVKSPEIVSAILIKDVKHFYNRGMELMMSKDKRIEPLGQNIFTAEGERWRELRQKMSPVFTSGKLKQMHDHVLDCVDLLIKFIDEHQNEKNSADLALKELFGKLTIDVIGSCAFGIDCQSLKSNDEFGKMFKEAVKFRLMLVVRIFVAKLSPRLADWLNLTMMDKKVNAFFLNLVLDMIHHRRQNGVTRNDLLQLLMDLQNTHMDPKFAVNDGAKKILWTEEFDELDIAANAFIFFVAGFESTASTLSFCMYELALNHDIQNKLRSEVQRFREKSGGQRMSYEILRSMPYMDAIINETLRKYPPAVFLNRKCTEDYTIPGTNAKILAGTDVLIPVWSIHHDWRNYSNPDLFDPGRFEGDNKHSRPSGAYIPFGDGPHLCLGKRFAEMEIKSALAELILRYNIKPCAKTDIPLQFKKGFGLETKCGTWVNFERRED